MLFTIKSLMCVLSALVFGVVISYGQSEQIFRKEKDKGTTVILVDPTIYIDKVVINQGGEAKGEAATTDKTLSLPSKDTVYIQRQDTFIVRQPEPEQNSLAEFDNVWNDSVAVGLELSRMTMRNPLLAVKTNLLLDGGYVPQYGFAPIWNVALEYYPKGGRWSVGASLDIPWWKKTEQHKYVQFRNWQAELRRYFWSDPGEYRHLYLQAYAHVSKFNLGFSDTKGWQGEGLGGGLGIGYVWRFTQRWRLEAGLQAGVFVAQYDPYVYGDPIDHVDNGYYYYDWDGKDEDFKRRNYRYTWIGPTRVGISITYNLFLRQRQKGEGR